MQSFRLENMVKNGVLHLSALRHRDEESRCKSGSKNLA
jgi:hypothetical protein